MFEVPVYNTQGKQVDTLQIGEETFGSSVNVDLVKQAVVTYHANRRQGTVKTKSRGDVAFSSKKIYRQKGTGNARHGDKAAPILRKGGHTFAKAPRDFSKALPRNMRRAALNSAILAKIIGQDIMVLEGLSCTEPKTGRMAELMKNLKVNRTCLLTLAERDKNVYLSSRNIPDLMVRIAEELNAYDVATRSKMVVTREAMKLLCGKEA
ncbi:MAG TPA: 50S ribosomal protein L4 [Phycisphaerae bacterium]|nr:50S ribosomal protein L4 [Phycisphaerae bacterium]HPS52808.1 50S ribosomal protein L4 [Phycisphaerae bacterium]